MVRFPARRPVPAAAVLALALLAASAPASAPAATTLQAKPAGDLVPGEVIVRFKSGASLERRAAVAGGELLRRLGVPGMVTLKVDAATDTVALAKELNEREDVLWAEPNTRMQLAAASNDPRFGELWGMHNAGQIIRGLTGVNDIDANVPEAWDFVTGGDTVVAVVDSGVAITHPDLAENIWNNPGETGTDAQGRDKKTNNIDDDGNRLVDDWRGWDFSKNDNDPSDGNGHGTHVAGTIAAVGNNGQGVVGVNWKARIMALKIGSESRTDSNVNADAAAAALAYAGSKGARVVNGSFSGGTPSQAQEDAIASNPNTLYVFAAGNNSTDNDQTARFPCNFNRSNIICVASINNKAALSNFSNFGTKNVDLAAPGGAVLSTSPFTVALDDPFEEPISGRWTPGAQNGSAPNAWGLGPSLANDQTKALTAAGGNPVPPNSGTFIKSNQLNLSLCKNPVMEFGYFVGFSDGADIFQVVLEAPNNGPAVVIAQSNGSPQGFFQFDMTPALNQISTKTPVLVLYVGTDGNQTTGVGPVIDDLKISCEPDVLQGTEYQYLDGTSMASPMVAGAATLVASQYPPGDVNYLRSAILGSVTPMPALSSKTVTGGRLNVRGALDTQGPVAFSTREPVDGFSTTNGQPTFTWDGTTDAKTGIRGYDLVVDGKTVASTDANGRSAAPTAPIAPGTHTWKVDAIDGAGIRTPSNVRTIVIKADKTGPKVTIKITKRTRKQLASKGFGLECQLGEPGACEVQIRVSKVDAKKLGLKIKKSAKTLTIAKGKAAVGPAGKVKMTIKASSKVKAAIRRARSKIRFTFRVTGKDAVGNRTVKSASLKA